MKALSFYFTNVSLGKGLEDSANTLGVSKPKPKQKTQLLGGNKANFKETNENNLL